MALTEKKFTASITVLVPEGAKEPEHWHLQRYLNEMLEPMWLFDAEEKEMFEEEGPKEWVLNDVEVRS